VQNFFRVVKLAALALRYAKKFPAIERDRVAFSRHGKNYNSAKTLNSSALLHCIAFCAENRAGENYFAAAARRRSNCASPANAEPWSYTQNLVE
jgi:hypothetical protein